MPDWLPKNPKQAAHHVESAVAHFASGWVKHCTPSTARPISALHLLPNTDPASLGLFSFFPPLGSPAPYPSFVCLVFPGGSHRLVMRAPPPRRHYTLSVIQQPLRAAEFGTGVLSRLPVSPPLIVRLEVRDGEGRSVDMYVCISSNYFSCWKPRTHMTRSVGSIRSSELRFVGTVRGVVVAPGCGLRGRCASRPPV